MNFLEILDAGIKSHKGLMKEIAEESGKTERWLRMVLNGERKDSELVLLASQRYADKEAKAKNQMQEAEQLVKAVQDARAAPGEAAV